MNRKANPIPDGFHAATPYLCIKGASAAIDYYTRAFGAREMMRHADPDGLIRHAQFAIGDSMFMISDEFPDMPIIRGIQSSGGSPVSIFLYVGDADATMAQAVAAGGKEVYPMADQPYGRSGGLADSFGLIWWITTP